MGRLIITVISIFLIFSCQDRKKSEKTKADNLIYKIKLSASYNDLRLIEDETNSFKYDTVIRNNLDAISDKYYDLEKFEDYHRVSNTILEESKKIEDTVGIIEGLCKKGAYYSNIYKLDSMYFYYTKAENYSIKTKSKYLLGTIFLNKAVINQNLNDYYNSEKNSFEALKILKNKNDYYLLYNTYLNIGYASFNQNDDREALKYFQKALNTTDKIKNNTTVLSLKGQAYYYYCLVYNKNNNYKASYISAAKGLSLDDFKTKDPHVFCNLNNCLGYSKFKLNDSNAKTHFIESLAIAKKANNIFAINTSNLYLSEYYLKYNDTSKAFLHANEVLQAANENKLYDDKLKALLLLAKASPNAATNYFETYKTLSDSIINNERQTRDKFAKIDYQTNEIISEKETIEKQKESILQQLWSVSTIAIFIILAVLLFYFIKSRNLKNKELIFIQEQQNAKEEIYELMLNQQHRIEEGKYSEKNRISQELHDGVMGKLMGIRLNLFILKKRQDPDTIEKCLPFIDDIQNVEKEIRQIAHDLNQNLFDDNVTFISIVENLFTMIKSHSDIEFILQVDERIDWDLINNNIKINIYRIIQETLQNIDKYAQASKVNLTMNKKENEIHITIADNGIGFKPDTSKKGIGLSNMKKRMEEINGKFILESIINKGTKINLIFQI
ncbi:ATP-binding protein [Flavobacterium terrigena]|uniref:histidine kinase n=1 Tax=Flavobacterium terrigena TaxID=402734 RepID=A0A1H6VKT4_9FLAO|nr:tetratricopeptide repeat-containing sensor histidine kinase [Flavobacterium terrigena]SEJ00922.1 Signal transduction histidine kinase [Flavobacterium terrigena]